MVIRYLKHGEYQNAVADLLNSILPKKVKNSLTLFNMGRLTTTSELSSVVVPEITINQILEAMKKDEA